MEGQRYRKAYYRSWVSLVIGLIKPPNHYTVPGPVACPRYCRPSIHGPWDLLHGWLALSWSILQPRGLYNHWAHKATCTIRALILHGETSTSWNILQAPRLYKGPQTHKGTCTIWTLGLQGPATSWRILQSLDLRDCVFHHHMNNVTVFGTVCGILANTGKGPRDCLVNMVWRRVVVPGTVLCTTIWIRLQSSGLYVAFS